MKAKFYISVLLIVFLALSGKLYAQEVVSGTVLSTWGEPIPEVAVSVEGSAELPVVTDSEGTFRLELEDLDCWLMVQPTGNWRARRIFLNQRSELVIYLTGLNQSSGDEELVIFDQKIPRRNIVAAYGVVQVDNQHYGPAMTIDEHMNGQVAGMYTVDRSGAPGSGAMNLIRGTRSVFSGTQPLYIIDGVPLSTYGLFQSNISGFEYNALLGINPFDISQTTVMKDAVLGVSYGSKGSNGLVFIETLSPSVTRTAIDVDLRTGLSLAPSRQLPQMDAGQHKTLMNELLFSSGYEEEVIREAVPGLFIEKGDADYIDYQHNTNWQDYIFENALLYNLNVQVKGGDEIARYGLSFGYMSADGITRNTGYDGYNLRFVSLLNIFTWLKMDASVGLSINTYDIKESAIVSETSPLMSALGKSPLLNPYAYDEDNKELSILADVNDLGVSNPLAVVENFSANNQNYNFTTTFGVEGRINEYMTLNSKFSFNFNILREQLFMPNKGMESYYNDEAYNVVKAANNSMNSLYNNSYLLYNRSFGDHVISSNTGVHIMSNKYQYDWGLGKNSHPNDEYRAMQDGQDNLREIGGANRNWNWLSFYENLNYSFRDKYLASLSLSLDGSSRLGDEAVGTLKLGGQPFGFFYSAGLAWRVSGESFMQDLNWIEDMKLRVSYGHTGNDDIGESSALDYYEAAKFRETVGLYPALMANNTLSYELINQLNAGVDLSLVGNRFSLSVDYFQSSTSDMIVYNPIEAYFGYDYIIENGGSLVNSGFELSTELGILKGSNFSWDVALAFTSMSNMITEIPGDKVIYSIPGGEKVNEKNFAANSFYGLNYLGVYSDMDDVTEYGNLLDDRGVAYGPGDAIFEDIGGPDGETVKDGRIDDYDKKVIGSPDPDFFTSLATKISYKRWSLSASIQYVHGFEVFNYVRYKNERMIDLSNQSTSVLNRWQYLDQDTNVPRATWADPMGNSDFSTRWIEDGDFLRLRNLTLAYTIPEKWAAFRNAEFYISASNLLTLTNYLGYDPEFSFSYSPVYQGVDYGMMPHPRQFMIGVKLGL